MAGRSHVDDSVIERRLRPIYEWLDTGNNKKAVQEAEKVLRKQPNLHCARVLKGLALLRVSRREECEAVISSVIKESPTDEATLQALTICFREMHQPDQICKVYEMAVKSEPSNEELLSHLFMAYVRIGDYKNQQQTAMKLYKLKPKNPYYFWAVMSHVMQAHKSADPKGKKVSLLLAERMVDKFVKEGKIEAEAEVLTYLHILETQEKYTEALAVLDGPLAKKVIHQPQNFLSLKRATYHAKLCQWEAAAAVNKTLIKEEPDNWQHYVEYIRTTMELKQSVAAIENGTEDPLVEAASFLEDMKQKTLVEKTKNRGPLLGLMQLALVLEQKGLSQQTKELCGDFMEILYQYIQAYGDKMCCYGDIVNFLPLVPKDQISHFLERIQKLVNFNEDGVPANIEAIHRNLCWLQLRRALGEQANLTPYQHVEFSESLVKLYQETLHLSSNMVDTDIRPGDAYLILAAHSFIKALQECEGNSDDIDMKHLVFKVASILEHGIEKSKANFQLKLLLIKIYNMLGATGASQTVYDKCDLKHIQLDTLGHVLALQALDSGNYTVAADIMSSTLKFFMANYKDTSDPLISSYKYGSLTRIPEFVDFRERLNNSLHFASVAAEQMLLDITIDITSHSQLVETVRQMDIDPIMDKINWKELCDNRDLRVMNSWEPRDKCLQEKDIKISTAADITMLRLRNVILRLVGVATKLGHSKAASEQASANKENSCVNGEATASTDTMHLADLTTQLEEEYKESSTYRNCKPPQLPLQGPDPSRVYLFLSGGYIPILVKHAQILQHIHSTVQGSAGDSENSSGVMIKECREQVEELVTSHLHHMEALQTSCLEIVPGVNPPALAHLHHLAQTLGIVAILLGCCFVFLKPIKAGVAKKNKKRKEPVTLPDVVPQFTSYVGALTSLLQKFEKTLAEKYKLVKKSTEENIKKNYSSVNVSSSLTSPEEGRTVCEKVEQSYVKSLERLSFSIGNKLKYVLSLKL